jgi:glycosyltransferase involved in cell wall biosynthesis
VRVSIVTPNMNHGRFLDQAISSVLRADHGELEYVVIDGGSTDESLAIIDKYRPRLSRVIVEPDDGPYDAINKGFAHTTGEVMGWINSSDCLFENSLAIVSEIFETFPEIQWLTSRVTSFIDGRGWLVEQGRHNGISRAAFIAGEHLPGYSKGRADTFIQQESTFWRRSLWEAAGSKLDAKLRLAGDFELWARFFQHAELWSVSAPLGAFRFHDDQLSANHLASYIAEAAQVLNRLGSRPRSRLRQNFSLALRYALPLKWRAIGINLRLLQGAPCCLFDRSSQRWELRHL